MKQCDVEYFTNSTQHEYYMGCESIPKHGFSTACYSFKRIFWMRHIVIVFCVIVIYNSIKCIHQHPNFATSIFKRRKK